MSQLDLAALSAALGPTRAGLQAAGFELALEQHGERLRLTVVPQEAPCEDCLVPKSLFKQMAQDEIKDARLPQVELEIVYPIDIRRQKA
jgi:hypothetical protein